MADYTVTRPSTSSISKSPRYERKDVNATGVLVSIGLLIATIGVVYVAAWWILVTFKAPVGGNLTVLPPEPRLEGIDELEAANTSDLNLQSPRRRLVAEQQQLNRFGWTDREKKIVHIPIRAAMQIAIERKLFPVAIGANSSESNQSANPSETIDSGKTFPSVITRSSTLRADP